jgi:hypothetical protein
MQHRFNTRVGGVDIWIFFDFQFPTTEFGLANDGAKILSLKISFLAITFYMS